MAGNTEPKSLSLGSRKPSLSANRTKPMMTTGLPTFNTPKLPALITKPANSTSTPPFKLSAQSDDENKTPSPYSAMIGVSTRSPAVERPKRPLEQLDDDTINLPPSLQSCSPDLELIAAIETTTCPVCNESFPSTKIHRHAATCLDQFQSGPRNSLSRTASSSTAQPLSSKLASKREACVSSDILSDFKGAKCPICHQALRARSRLSHVKHCAKLNSMAPADLIALLRSTNPSLLRQADASQTDFQSPPKRTKQRSATTTDTNPSKDQLTKPTRKKPKSSRKTRTAPQSYLVSSSDLTSLLPLLHRRFLHLTRCALPAPLTSRPERAPSSGSTTLFWMQRQACSVASGHYNRSLMSTSLASETKRQLAGVDEDMGCWMGEDDGRSTMFGMNTPTPSPKQAKRLGTALAPQSALCLASVSTATSPSKAVGGILLDCQVAPSLQQHLAMMAPLEALSDVEIIPVDATQDSIYLHRLVLATRMPQLAMHMFRACTQHVNDRVLPRHRFQPTDPALVAALYDMIYLGQATVPPFILAKLLELCAITSDDVLRTALAPFAKETVVNDLSASQTSGFMVLDIQEVFGPCLTCKQEESAALKPPLTHRALSVHEADTPGESRVGTRPGSPQHAGDDRNVLELDQHPSTTLLASSTVPTSTSVLQPESASTPPAAHDMLVMFDDNDDNGDDDDDDDDDELPAVVLSTQLKRPSPQATARDSDTEDELPPTGLEVSLLSQRSLPAYQLDDVQSPVSVRDELQNLSFDALRKEAGDYGLKTRGVGRSDLIKELAGIRVQASQQGLGLAEQDSEVEDSLEEGSLDRDTALLSAIRALPALHERILMMEPIPLAELQQVCDEHAISFKPVDLQEFCDMHTITWTAAKTRKRRLKKALKK